MYLQAYHLSTFIAVITVMLVYGRTKASTFPNAVVTTFKRKWARVVVLYVAYLYTMFVDRRTGYALFAACILIHSDIMENDEEKSMCSM